MDDAELVIATHEQKLKELIEQELSCCKGKGEQTYVEWREIRNKSANRDRYGPCHYKKPCACLTTKAHVYREISRVESNIKTLKQLLNGMGN